AGGLRGRDPFSRGVILPQTADATLSALDGFRDVVDSYGVPHIRAVATSAVREARNSELFLDRIRGRTGIAFEVINEAEESRLVFMAVKQALGRRPALRVARTLLAEVGGGSTSLTLLRQGEAKRPAAYGRCAGTLRPLLEL